MRDEPVVFWDFDGTLAQREGLWPQVLYDAAMSVDPVSEASLLDLLRV